MWDHPYGVMFHHFHDHDHAPGQGSISAEQLDELLGFVGVDRILPAEEWMTRALDGRLRDRDVCLTFDDNLRCQYDVAYPVLESHGLTAFWFVPTSVMTGQLEPMELYRVFRCGSFDNPSSFYAAFTAHLGESALAGEVERALEGFVPATYLQEYPVYTDEDRHFRYLRDQVLGPERYRGVMEEMLDAAGFDREAAARNLWMDDECVQELRADGNVIGLHTHTHPTNLVGLTAEEQRAEYAENWRHLRDILGQEPITVSHPCGSYSETTLSILRERGVRLGFRANMALPEPPSMLEYPREDHMLLIRAMQGQ